MYFIGFVNIGKLGRAKWNRIANTELIKSDREPMLQATHNYKCVSCHRGQAWPPPLITSMETPASTTTHEAELCLLTLSAGSLLANRSQHLTPQLCVWS